MAPAEAPGDGIRTPRIVAVDREAPDPAIVAEAAEVLRAGALVAFPTDTLYALAADPFRPGALERVFAAKGRDAAKVVSLLLADAAMAPPLIAALLSAARTLIDRFWPGPLTIVLPASAGMPPALVPPGGGIGLRVPRDILARSILRTFGGPLVGTSANRAGGPEPRDAGDVLSQVGSHLALLLDGGRTPAGIPSTVVDCTVRPPRLLRAGALPPEAIREVLPELSGRRSARRSRKS